MIYSLQPMNRFGLVQSLKACTFQGSEILLERTVQQIIVKNNGLLKDTFSGFFFDQEVYGKPTPSKKTPRLHKSLEDDLKNALKDFGFKETVEYKKIAHFFGSTTNNTVSYPELKLLYPDGLHQVLVQFQDILTTERRKSDEWLETQMRLFHDVRESILHRLCLNLLITN